MSEIYDVRDAYIEQLEARITAALAECDAMDLAVDEQGWPEAPRSAVLTATAIVRRALTGVVE